MNYNKISKSSDYMSPPDYTINILNIKDKNIILDENYPNGFNGRLTYNSYYCPFCSYLFEYNLKTLLNIALRKNVRLKCYLTN